MADDDAINVATKIIGVAVGSSASAFFAAGASSWLALKLYREGRLSRGWWRLRVVGLGGVTTLDQALGYDCALCRLSLDQREEVRTLSCDHVFHFRKGAKCSGNTVDDWLRENRMRCPVCCRIAYPVLPWKAPPTSPPPAPSRSPSTTDLEAQLQQSSATDLETQVSQPSAMGVGPPAPPRPPPMPSSPWFKDTLRSRSRSPSQPPSQSPSQ
nr:unnamed protein product [Digitaria exilis]